jgi:hypothetical protein
MNPNEDGYVADVFYAPRGFFRGVFAGEFADEFDIHFSDEVSGGGRFGVEEVE